MIKKFFAIFLCAFLLVGSGCKRAPRTISPTPMVHVTPARIPTIPSSQRYHTLLRGETMYRVSKMYEVDLDELMRVNAIVDPNDLEVGRRLLIPGVGTLVPKSRIVDLGGPLTISQVGELVGPKSNAYGWNTITVHHSGTTQGAAYLFHRDHLRRKMGGLFYHFVIGNGSYSKDGEIEIGWRWKKQVKANRAHDIQICLVGNFNQQEVSKAQLDSLSKLVTILREQYGISLNHIRRHKDIKNKHTDCPGNKFPFSQLLSLSNNATAS